MSKVMTEEDAIFQEVADALEKESKKKSEPQQGGLKLTAEAVTRKITEAEFETMIGIIRTPEENGLLF